MTVYSALKKLGDRIRTGPILIIGAGGLGLMALRVLHAMGGFGAVVLDIDPAKRQAASAAGALAALDPTGEDANDRVLEALEGV